MSDKYHHIAIALAGVCQSVNLVPPLANHGKTDTHLYDISISSIFNQSPTSTEDVFSGVSNLKLGLQTLARLFSAERQHHVEIMRYTFASISLANKLLKHDQSLNKISERLVRIQTLYPDISLDTIKEHRDELSYSLAGIYSDIVSPLSAKIRVVGKVEYLQNALIQAKVRTALFSSVRSAILWYQMGGNRLQFLLSRKHITYAVNDILQQLNSD